MVQDNDLDIAHTKHFVLNDDFEIILDNLENNEVIENDLDEVSESVNNIYCTCFLFNYMF